jgi:methyl-accepting chemotaxis protein
VETFYNARPFKITNEQCLVCHDTPARAPASLVRTYGPTNGFGWKLADVIAAQVVYVPAQGVIETARSVTLQVMGIFLVVFLLAMLSINILVRRNVVHPLTIMGQIATKVSLGDLHFSSVEQKQMAHIAQRPDEIGDTARVLEKMTSEVRKREDKLTSEVRALRIQVDEARKVRQVAEITESDYFQDLKAKINALKNRPSTTGAAPAPAPAPGD